MKNSTIKSTITAAALGMAVAFSVQAAADAQQRPVENGLTGEQLQLETIRSLDAVLTERMFVPSVSEAVEEQDAKMIDQVRSQAEALYQLHNNAGSIELLQVAHL